MSERQGLVETMRNTGVFILELRKAIAASGHSDAMTEIDALLAKAQTATHRRIAAEHDSEIMRP